MVWEFTSRAEKKWVLRSAQGDKFVGWMFLIQSRSDNFLTALAISGNFA
jgi:hypothetical protein